jgi:hypothetical protein
VALLAVKPVILRAQTPPTIEGDITGGYSREGIGAAAAQIRAFGDLDRSTQIQYVVDTNWAKRWAGDEPVSGGGLIGVDPLGTDVFGAAYPYRNRLQVIEAYAERFFRPAGAMLGIRGGQFRAPFGISSRSDYGYSGFIRPPLIRYDGYFGVSNNWLERGALVTAGVPRLFVEASVSRPYDVGTAIRSAGTDESIRAQGYYGPFIIGVSHARSEPYLPASFAHGRQRFTGIDLRYATSGGIQLRGEFLHGHSFTSVTTDGWYLDAFVHRVGMGPVTAVARIESTDYKAAALFARAAHRVTAGARVRVQDDVTAQLNVMHQRGDLPHIYDTSVDFTITYSFRYR